MRIGIDIVRVKRLEKLLSESGAAKKIFHDSEISDNCQSMAGFLAAKEAYFKALGKKGDWLEIRLGNEASGQPKIISSEYKDISLSISHDGDYAVAVVVIGDI